STATWSARSRGRSSFTSGPTTTPSSSRMGLARRSGPSTSRKTEYAWRRAGNDQRLRGTARPNRGGRALLSPAWPLGLWRPGRAGRPDGTRSGGRARLADERRDARGDCDLPVAAGTARDPGRDLHLLPARRFLGRVGRGLDLHPAELPDRCGAWGALRLSWRPEAGDGDLLRREPRRYRSHSAFLLASRQARDGGPAAMGDRSRLFRRDHRVAGGGRAPLH